MRIKMGEVVDFQTFKDRKIVDAIEFIPSPNEGWCPFCSAPTLVTRTSGGTEIHTFDPNNMQAYEKLKTLLLTIISYFKDTDQSVSDDDLIEAFGEGMKEFLKELHQNHA